MIRTCESCGTRNRVPAERLSDTGRCGSCKSPLPPLNEPLDVGGAEFAEITQAVKVPVLVDFWAPWCGPCQVAGPEVARAAEQMAGKAVVLKVNSDAHPDVAARFGVRGIPHFAILKGGRQVSSRTGLVPSAELVEWLAQA